jgi:hypothetical protein
MGVLKQDRLPVAAWNVNRNLGMIVDDGRVQRVDKRRAGPWTEAPRSLEEHVQATEDCDRLFELADDAIRRCLTSVLPVDTPMNGTMTRQIEVQTCDYWS